VLTAREMLLPQAAKACPFSREFSFSAKGGGGGVLDKNTLFESSCGVTYKSKVEVSPKHLTRQKVFTRAPKREKILAWRERGCRTTGERRRYYFCTFHAGALLFSTRAHTQTCIYEYVHISAAPVFTHACLAR